EAPEREQRKPPEHRAARTEAGRSDPARHAAHERAGTERSDQDAGGRLREVELIRIAGHERRQRSEEHRVDEDDRADEDEQPAHRSLSLGSVSCCPDSEAIRPDHEFTETGELSSSAPMIILFQRPAYQLVI